jgi:hypothetical protein
MALRFKGAQSLRSSAGPASHDILYTDAELRGLAEICFEPRETRFI